MLRWQTDDFKKIFDAKINEDDIPHDTDTGQHCDKPSDSLLEVGLVE